MIAVDNLRLWVYSKLVANWRSVIRRAWSMRLMTLSIALSAAEVAMPYAAPEVHSGIFAALAALVTGAAGIARLMAQKSMPKDG